MQRASLHWVTLYNNTEDHYFNIHTTKMTNLTSPKKYPGARRQIMHAELLIHLPFFDFHPVSYSTAIQNPSFTGQRFNLIHFIFTNLCICISVNINADTLKY